jgi:GDP-L-fucose synthase
MMGNKPLVLLTGGRGMVGRNLLEHPFAAQFDFLAPTSEELDLRNFPKVQEYVSLNKPEFVIHTAGLVGGIQANMARPVEFLIENIDVGRNIVLASRNAEVKKLLNLSSSCMYPKNALNPLTEDLILTGELEPTNEGYALAKIVTMRLCEYIYKEDNSFQYKTFIPCNLFGRFDKFDPKHSHLIPAIIHKIHLAKINQEKSVEIWGDGFARREFMYAGDLADAMMRVLVHFDSTPSLMNIGLGVDYSINEYYEVVAKVIGWDGSFSHDLSKPVGMRQKLISTARQKNWGWDATTSLEEGVSKAYDYYLKVSNEF